MLTRKPVGIRIKFITSDSACLLPLFFFFPLCLSLQKLVIHLLYFILSSPPLALFFFSCFISLLGIKSTAHIEKYGTKYWSEKETGGFYWLCQTLAVHTQMLSYILERSSFMAIYRIILSNILDEKWPHLNFSFHSCSQSLRQVSFDCCSDEFLFREWSMYSSSYVQLKRMHIRNPAPMERSLGWRRVLEGWGGGIE